MWSMRAYETWVSCVGRSIRESCRKTDVDRVKESCHEKAPKYNGRVQANNSKSERKQDRKHGDNQIKR